MKHGLDGTMIAEVGFKGLWVLAKYLPAFLLRRYFTASRLAGLVYVDVMPRNDAVTLNLAAPGTAAVYLQIINLAPVAIQLEQAEFRLTAGSISTKFTVVRKQRFEVGEIGAIQFDQSLQDSQARTIAQQLRDLRHLDGIRARVFNENYWQSVGAAS
jgi:hypothetical protein